MRKTDYDVEAHRGDCPYGEYLSAYRLDEIVEAIHAVFAWEEACRTGRNPDPASIDFEIDRIVDEDGKDLTGEARKIQKRMKAEGWKYYKRETPASSGNGRIPSIQ